jgi:hypothetical protein
MKHILLGACVVVALASVPATADDFGASNGCGFSAPNVSGDTNIGNPKIGDIVFDTNASGFYGYAGSTWVQLGTTSTSNVSSTTSGQEHVERALLTSTCTSSPCTISYQSGSWLTSVTRNSAGNYTLNIASGEFSAPPSCTFTVAGAAAIFAQFLSVPTATSVNIGTFASGSTTDSWFSVVCMGPR